MKKNIGKRILSLALALVMVAGWLPRMATEAHAAEPITLEDNTFTTSPGQGFAFRAYFYCHECGEYVYTDSNTENHNFEITSFTYKIANGTAEWNLTANYQGCRGSGTGINTYSCSYNCTEKLNRFLLKSYGWDPNTRTYHGAICVYITREKTTHQGDATCKTAKNCTLCGTSYTNASNHEKPDEFTYSVNTSDSTKHDKKYACCGATMETVVHTAEPTYTVNATDHTKHDKTYSCCEGIAETTGHSYTYAADSFVLTETCSNGCGHQAIASIVAGEAIYTGSEITDAATISYDSGTWAGATPVLSYENNMEVGTATAKMTAGGATASTTFKINPASISYATVTFDPENGTYNGNAYTPGVTVTFNGATLLEDTDYTLSWDKSGFTNADTYTVTVTGEGNFEGTTERTFTISAANLADVKVEQVGTLTYTGEALTPAVSANAVAVNNQPITFTYSTESEGPYSTEIPSFTNAGWAHTVYYRVTADNHNTYFGSFLVEIEKATVTEPTIASKPYNGSVQTADITDTELYTVVKNDGGTGAKENGCYDVVLELKDSANYKWSTTDNAQVTLQFKITRAENEWTVDPSITGWTYGEAAKVPVGEAKFGEVSVEYSGTTNGGAAYSSSVAPTEAGSYTATFIVQETEDYKGLETSVDFTIAKADQAAPTGLTKTDTTYFGKADGKISGLTSAMEFRKEGDSTYTAGFNGTLGYLAAGTYYVRYQGDANHNPSPDAVVTVNAGRKLQIVVPQNQVGYTVTVNKTEMEYEGSYTLKVEIHEGYTATEDFKIIISNWECGQQAGVEKTYMNAIADQIIEVRGVADITPPAAEIKVKENKWTSFWNNLTFSLFFKETQDVTITAVDAGSGVNTVQYYLAGGELEIDEVRAITNWVDYNGTFKIDPNNRYVVYAKVTDNAGNVEYINSEGIVLDATAPVLYGIENGGVYHGDKVFKATDDYLRTLKVDGVDVMAELNGDNEYKIIADNAEHTVTAIDEAGNVTEYKITVYKNYTVTYKIDGETVDTQTVGHGKDANLPAVPAKNGYVGKWDSDGKNITGDTTITVVYTEIPVVKPNDVKPEDRTDLEDTKAKLEDMLKDDSYTDEDKKNIQDAIDDIDDALEVIGNVEAVEDLIDKLPENITKNDEDAIKAADDAYHALSDYEKALVDEAAKKALDDAKAALAELNKPADTDSPQTGDNSNMFLWIALLFISGGAVITLTVVDRKRRMANKR